MDSVAMMVTPDVATFSSLLTVVGVLAPLLEEVAKL